MKVKHILIVSLILTILTIGAVSASEIDDLAANEDTDDAVSQVDDEGLIADESEDTRNEADYDTYIPKDVRTDDSEASIDVNVRTTDISGNISVKIGEDEVYNEEIIPYTDKYWDWESDEWVSATGGNSINIRDLNLRPGTYDVEISYAGDDNYKAFTKTGTLKLYFMDVHVRDEIRAHDFNIDLADDATGNVIVYIDDKLYKNLTAHELRENGFRLSDLEYTNHSYRVTYEGDDYTLDEAFEGEFNLTYAFSVWLEDSEIPFGNSAYFTISYPATGVVLISYNGKSKTVNVNYDEDDEKYDSISDLNLGKNKISFTYKGEGYPEKTIVKTVDVSPKLYVPSEMRYANEEDAIVIQLPENATGKLVISKEIWNESLADYGLEIIDSVALVGGKANYTLNKLGLGSYYIKAAYDGDDYEVESDTSYVNIVPNVVYEEYIYTEAENSIKVVLPENGDDNLTVSVSSTESDDESEIYNKIANGTVTVSLPKLADGTYYLHVSYGESYSKSYYFYVMENAPEFELKVDFPSEINFDHRYITISGVPEDANGQLRLYINGSCYEDIDMWDDEGNYLRNGEYRLDYDVIGTHTWEIRFEDDVYYKEASKSGTFLIDWIYVPKKIDLESSVEVSLNDKEGYVELKVDGKAYDTVILEYGYAEIPLNKLTVGKHTYEISYYDNANKKQLTKSGSFEITYDLSTNIDEEYHYGLTKEFELFISVPEDAKATITVNVDGKKYTATPVNGTATVILTNLVIGENNITVSYAGDSKYPADEIRQVINITGYAITEKYNQNDGFESVSIMLPADAKGNLSLYRAHYVEGHDEEDEEGIWSWTDGYWEIEDETPVKTVKLADGYAIIKASEFKVGSYALIARYDAEDDDYEVDDVEISFIIYPEVNITDEIVIGDNVTVSIAIPDATGNIEIYQLTDDAWNLIKTVESDNGIFKTSVSDIKLGYHEFKFIYVGEDMDNPFVYDDEEYLEPVIYHVTVKPSNVAIPEKFSSDGSGEIALELAEGSTGKVSVYESKYNPKTDGEELIPIFENASYTSANKTVKVSGLTSGSHKLVLKYIDDKEGEYTQYADVQVPKPDAGSDVTIPESLSGDSFDVVLPKDATGNILVTVDGESKMIPLVNGSAKVDLSSLADGTHTVTVKYMGDGNYSGFEKSANITVKNAVDPKITAKDASAVYTAGTKYSATIYGTDGKVAANTDVTFLVNGKVFKTVKTNAKGVASVKITQKPGSYKITTKALGIEVTKKLTVKHIVKLQKVKVKRSAKKLVIKVTLSKVNGKYPKGKVTLKFKGKKYTAKIKKGVAKFTIKKKVLKKLKKGKKVTYQATYLKDTVKYTVKVKK